MKKKTAKQEPVHLYTPFAVALVIVVGLVVSIHTHVQNSPRTGGPSMGAETASAQESEKLPIQKEVINAYASGKFVYVVVPDMIINSVAPKTSQFSILDGGLLVPVRYVALQNDTIILELDTELTGKTVTVSYRDVVQGRLYTYKSGYVRTFREKIVEPTDNINAILAQSCVQRVPSAESFATMTRDNVTKIQWFLSQQGYYDGPASGSAQQNLVNAIGRFQVVNAEALSETNFSLDNYGVWDEFTAALAKDIACR